MMITENMTKKTIPAVHLRHFSRGWTFLADEHYLIVVRYTRNRGGTEKIVEGAVLVSSVQKKHGVLGVYCITY